MSRIAYAALGKRGSFNRDNRYLKPVIEEPPVEGDIESPADKAYRDGFQDGQETARAEFEAQLQAQIDGRTAIELAFARFDAETGRELRDRLLATVHALCEEAVLPLAVDTDGLTKRVEAAVAMLQRKHDQRIVHIHPEDLELIKDNLPSDLELVADANVERGGLRVETDGGGVEDGPLQWRRALAEMFASCEH